MANARDLERRIVRLENIYRNTFFEGEVVKINKIGVGETAFSLSGDLGTDYCDVEVHIPRVGRTVKIENATLVDSRITNNTYGIALTKFDYHERSSRFSISSAGHLRTRGSRVLVICPYGNFQDEVYVVGRFGL